MKKINRLDTLTKLVNRVEAFADGITADVTAAAFEMHRASSDTQRRRFRGVSAEYMREIVADLFEWPASLSHKDQTRVLRVAIPRGTYGEWESESSWEKRRAAIARRRQRTAKAHRREKALPLMQRRVFRNEPFVVA